MKCLQKYVYNIYANLVRASLDVLGGEEGQLFEVGVLGPHGLGDHLGQLHGCQGWAQPAVTGQHVHTGLDQTDSLQRANGTQC